MTTRQRVRTVQLFVSSPGDVEHERRRVDRVAERLNGELAGVARIETIRREASSYGAHGEFQGQAPEAADCDIVLAILWSSLGSELPSQFPRMPGGAPYPSATGYEVLSAIRARTSKQRPDVFVFRKTERPRFAIDDAAGLDHALMQWTRLQDFFERWFVTPQGRSAFTSFETTDEFESKVEALLREWLEAHVLHGRSAVWPIAIKGSPFRGLAPFEAEHAPVFFGRARDVVRAIDRFKAAAERGTPFLLVVGASGAGKSSLVRAGLAPRLTAPGVAADVDIWRVALMRPGPRPIEELAETLFARGDAAATDGHAPTQALPELADGDCKTPAALAAFLRRGDATAARPILAALDRIGREEQRRGGLEQSLRVDLLLVVDQLDELFAADVSAADRAGFAKALRALVASERVWVVATLRAALYELFLGESDLEALKAAGADYDLAPPGPADLAEIVRKPAEAAGLVYETNAVGERLDDRLLRDAAGVDMLPPLQLALQRLFAERQIVGPERRLAFAAYGALGGVGGAIDLAAERALAGLGEAEAGALPRLLRQLAIPVHEAAPNDAGRPLLTIRAATLLETATDAAACRLVDALVEARILVHAKERGVPTIGLAHDRVLESWQRARAIVAGNLLRVREETGGLAAGSATPKRQWLSTAAAALLAAVAAVAAVAAIASWQYFEARAAKQTAERAEMAAVAERDRAARQRQLAEDERTQSEEQRDIAQKRQERAEAQRQLAQDRQQEAEEQRGIARKLEEEAEAHRLLAEVRRKEAEVQRNRALMSRSRFLADLADQKLKSGDDIAAILLALEALPDENSGVVRPLEPQRVLDKAWRFEGDERIPREAQVLIGHAGSIRSCALSRDGLHAVTGSADKTARVWDTQTGATVAQLNGHSADIAYVAFTADGSKILTAAGDGVRIWDATTGASSAIVPEARSLVAISDNGQQLISSSAPNRVHLWDANTRQELTRTLGGAILDTRLGPEGARVLVAAAGNSIELYEPASGNRLRVFRGHANKVLSAAISRDGQRIASVGDDQTARIWSVPNGTQLIALADAKFKRDFPIRLSPDGRLALIASDSGFRLYAIDARRPVAELPVADGEPAAALFSPDGKFIVTASRAQGGSPPLTLWDGTTGKQLAVLEQAAETTCARVSQDGRQLLTGTADGIARLWKLDRNTDPVPPIAAGMRGHDRDTPAAAQALVELSKAHVPRCLTRAQREKAFLDAEPPAWCIELAKWPYHTQAWKDWLGYKRENADPPSPDTSEWQPWLASRTAGQGGPLPK